MEEKKIQYWEMLDFNWPPRKTSLHKAFAVLLSAPSCHIDMWLYGYVLFLELWSVLYLCRFNELGQCAVIQLTTQYVGMNYQITPTQKVKPFSWINSRKSKADQPEQIWNTYFLYNVGYHVKNQPLLGSNEKRKKKNKKCQLEHFCS